MGSITVVGLGPGRFGLITLESWEIMQQAQNLVLRTAIHPTVEDIKKRGLAFTSYDGFYEAAGSFEALYQAIAKDLLARAARGEDIVYAVPGSPLVAERTVVLLRDMAKESSVQLTILPGMSFVEVLYVRLGIDPIDGLTIIDAEDFAALPADLPTGLVITQVYNVQIASDTKLALMEAFPDDYPVIYVHNLGLPDESLRTIPLYELDRQPDVDHLTSLFVPAQPAKPAFDMTPLTDIMRTLREPGGCPWDIAQNHKSLRKNLIEEAYEVIEAIDEEDAAHLCEELGDLLLQVVFHARLAEESGSFSMQDVVDGITEKLVRRHPHIFGDVQARDAGEALLSWEAAKRQEKPERTSRLDGVPKELPALMSAEKLQKKAAKAGFDWQDILPVQEKLTEELTELKEAMVEQDAAHITEELGDVLFTVVNLARFLQVDPEFALRQTNEKFRRRFIYVEKQAAKQKKDLRDYTLAELDGFWNAAKKAE